VEPQKNLQWNQENLLVKKLSYLHERRRMQLSPKLIESAFHADLLEEPMPLDIAVHLMGEGYILEKTAKEEHNHYG
tara:strand:+ start:324 stop:551 length:228 start_codon:yes stop_codon:yes gene_type:complete